MPATRYDRVRRFRTLHQGQAAHPAQPSWHMSFDEVLRPVPRRSARTGFVWVLLLGLVLLLESAALNAAEPQWTPKNEGRITDLAHVLLPTERERLSNTLARHERETHHQLAVLTVPTLAGEGIESFSLRVANAWQLGYSGLNDGILVTLAIKERQVRIEVGRGMERYVTDASAQSIINTAMVPAFRKGEYAGGLDAGLQILIEEGRRFVVPATGLSRGVQK